MKQRLVANFCAEFIRNLDPGHSRLSPTKSLSITHLSAVTRASLALLGVLGELWIWGVSRPGPHDIEERPAKFAESVRSMRRSCVELNPILRNNYNLREFCDNNFSLSPPLRL
jgi:hypothetical protein